MLRTYRAILHGDQVEWLEPPQRSPGRSRSILRFWRNRRPNPRANAGARWPKHLPHWHGEGPLPRSPTLWNGNASSELNGNCLTGSRDASG